MTPWTTDLYIAILKYNLKISELVVIFGKIHLLKGNESYKEAQSLKDWIEWMSKQCQG